MDLFIYFIVIIAMVKLIVYLFSKRTEMLPSKSSTNFEPLLEEKTIFFCLSK